MLILGSELLQILYVLLLLRIKFWKFFASLESKTKFSLLSSVFTDFKISWDDL
jgi:hypothetical protein